MKRLLVTSIDPVTGRMELATEIPRAPGFGETLRLQSQFVAAAHNTDIVSRAAQMAVVDAHGEHDAEVHKAQLMAHLPSDIAFDPESQLASFHPLSMQGGFHRWRIESKFPIPGAAIKDDAKRRALPPLVVNADVAAMEQRKNYAAQTTITHAIQQAAEDRVGMTAVESLVKSVEGSLAARECAVVDRLVANNGPPTAPAGLDATSTTSSARDLICDGVGDAAENSNLLRLFTLLSKRDTAGVARMLERGLVTGAALETNGSGVTALMRASSYGMLDAVRLLLAHGAAPNVINESTSMAAIHMAWDAWRSTRTVLAEARKARLAATREIIRALLTAGADVNLPSGNGSTALHIAACTDHEEIAAVLLRFGASTEALDGLGRTPLTLAVSSGSAHVEGLLRLWPSITPQIEREAFRKKWGAALKLREAAVAAAAASTRLARVQSGAVPGRDAIVTAPVTRESASILDAKATAAMFGPQALETASDLLRRFDMHVSLRARERDRELEATGTTHASAPAFLHIGDYDETEDAVHRVMHTTLAAASTTAAAVSQDLVVGAPALSTSPPSSSSQLCVRTSNRGAAAIAAAASATQTVGCSERLFSTTNRAMIQSSNNILNAGGAATTIVFDGSGNVASFLATTNADRNSTRLLVGKSTATTSLTAASTSSLDAHTGSGYAASSRRSADRDVAAAMAAQQRAKLVKIAYEQKTLQKVAGMRVREAAESGSHRAAFLPASGSYADSTEEAATPERRSNDRSGGDHEMGLSLLFRAAEAKIASMARTSTSSRTEEPQGAATSPTREDARDGKEGAVETMNGQTVTNSQGAHSRDDRTRGSDNSIGARRRTVAKLFLDDTPESAKLYTHVLQGRPYERKAIVDSAVLRPSRRVQMGSSTVINNGAVAPPSATPEAQAGPGDEYGQDHLLATLLLGGNRTNDVTATDSGVVPPTQLKDAMAPAGASTPSESIIRPVAYDKDARVRSMLLVSRSTALCTAAAAEEATRFALEMRRRGSVVDGAPSFSTDLASASSRPARSPSRTAMRKVDGTPDSPQSGQQQQQQQQLQQRTSLLSRSSQGRQQEAPSLQDEKRIAIDRVLSLGLSLRTKDGKLHGTAAMEKAHTGEGSGSVAATSVLNAPQGVLSSFPLHGVALPSVPNSSLTGLAVYDTLQRLQNDDTRIEHYDALTAKSKKARQAAAKAKQGAVQSLGRAQVHDEWDADARALATIHSAAQRLRDAEENAEAVVQRGNRLREQTSIDAENEPGNTDGIMNQGANKILLPPYVAPHSRSAGPQTTTSKPGAGNSCAPVFSETSLLSEKLLQAGQKKSRAASSIT